MSQTADWDLGDESLLIVGVDCATVDNKVGMALAEYGGQRLSVREVEVGSRRNSPVDVILHWLRNATVPVLLALDAPLGWPEPMGRVLYEHTAGEPIEVESNDLFRRETDRFIQAELSKTPLDVGANLIARTAHAALGLLQELRARFGLPIPLAWGVPFADVAAIEVYPAATLVAHSFRSASYKGRDQVDERRELIASLAGLLDLGAYSALLEHSADALDAVVCTLAAMDFLQGRAKPPVNLALAKREGWIWAAPHRQV